MGGRCKENAREGFLRALIFDDECMSQEGQGCQWDFGMCSEMSELRCEIVANGKKPCYRYPAVGTWRYEFQFIPISCRNDDSGPSASDDKFPAL